MPKHNTKKQAAKSTGKMASASGQKELSNADLERVAGGQRSRFNESETLASSVQKKRDDVANAVIQKI